MINKKKTMYEILGVQPDASYTEIKTAHQKLSDKLHSEKNTNNGEDIDFKLKLINVAFHTLSIPASRDAYDVQQAELNASAIPPEHSSNSIVALSTNTEAMSLKAEAMLLRAEAMSLRADALAIRNGVAVSDGNDVPLKGIISKIFSGLMSTSRRFMFMLLTFVAFMMVIQAVFLVVVKQKEDRTIKEEEKLYIQQYYQENGIRIQSQAEGEMLDAERRREENKKREVELEERAKTRLEEEANRFAEESRRSADKISENLRRDEERLRHEEERKQEKLEQEKRRMEKDEIDRIEREKARWRGNSYQSPYSNE